MRMRFEQGDDLRLLRLCMTITLLLSIASRTNQILGAKGLKLIKIEGAQAWG